VKRFLTIKNCCDYYVCATEFGLDDNCADHISSYITKRWGQVIRTDGFMCLAHTHPVLVVQLVRLEREEEYYEEDEEGEEEEREESVTPPLDRSRYKTYVGSHKRSR